MYAIDFKGKTGVIFGVASERSIAWAIGKLLHQAGTHLVFSYQNEKLEKRIESLIESLGRPKPLAFQCDVTKDGEVEDFFNYFDKYFKKLDFLVHSIAFAPREALQGRFLDTTLEDFETTFTVSSGYSLIKLANKAVPLMSSGGSIIAMTFLASKRAVPVYNVMGTAKAALEQEVRQLALELAPKSIRVNAISAGPVETLAFRGIPDSRDLLEVYDEKAPLGNISQKDPAGLALFLCSDLAEKITGQTIFVDGGYNTVL